MKPPYILTLAFAATSFTLTGLAQAQTPVLPVTPLPAPPPVRVRPVPEPYPADEKPDYPGAVWEPASPLNFQKFDRVSREHPINCIVIHDIEGSGISAVRWFQNPAARVTSHYVIAADGTVYQLVKERDVAWHAGNRDINTRSVGIEHEGFAYRPGFYNDAEYDASARLVRSVALRYNIPRDRVHIFGHAEVPNATDPTKFGGSSGHTDPGPYWDWDYFMALVRNDATVVLDVGASSTPPVVSVKLRPGEKGETVFSFTNTGDDPWPADTKPPRPNPELRQSGPVYLGATHPPAERAGVPLGWVSPQFAVAPDSGEVPTGQNGRFVVPLVGGVFAGAEQTQSLRLWKVFPAPHTPAAFGPTVSVSVITVPWDIIAPLPPTPPIGWSEKSLLDVRVFWHASPSSKAMPMSNTPKPDAVSWSAALPIAGQWDIYVRVISGHRTAQMVYEVPAADSIIHTVRWNGQSTPDDTDKGWHKLGRYRFEAPPVNPAIPTLGTRPSAATTLAPAQIKGRVNLLPSAKQAAQSGIVSIAGDVRFVGPFP